MSSTFAMNPKHRRPGASGFTLIELLIVVAIIGIIAAIIIPNLLDSIQKSKQKRTMTDMRLIGTSWMSWLTDQVSASAAGSTQASLNWSSLAAMTHEELAETLIPQYANEIPRDDSWGTGFDYGEGEPFSLLPMAIRSQGNDYAYDGDSYVIGPFLATDYGQDLVWAGGYFVRWPDGLGQD